MTADPWTDQADAATSDLAARCERSLGRTLDGTIPKQHPLYRQVETAVTAAITGDRCCRHVDLERPRPLLVDIHRHVLHCGECISIDELVPLPGDEEHRCDGCRAIVDARRDMCVLAVRYGFALGVFMVCRDCFGEVHRQVRAA